MHSRITLGVALVCLAGAALGSGGHGQPEYLALYSFGVGGSHILQFWSEAVGETQIEFMVVPSSSADVEGMMEAKDASETAWKLVSSGSEAPTSLPVGSSAVPSRSVVYAVPLVASAAASAASRPVAAVPLAIPEGGGAYTLLLSHGEVPVEVVGPGGGVHVQPAASESNVGDHVHGDGGGDGTVTASAGQWANALAASFLISVCSLVGIITIVSSRVARSINLPLAFLFASGALLTTAVVHIIPEAMQGLEREYPGDFHGLVLRSGITIMAGISGGFLLHVVLDSGAGGEGGAGHSYESEPKLPPPLTVSAATAVPGPGVVMEAGAVVVRAPSAEVVDGCELGRRRNDRRGADGMIVAVDSHGDPQAGPSGGVGMDGGLPRENLSGAPGAAAAAAASKSHRIEAEGGATIVATGLASTLYEIQRQRADRGLFEFTGLDPVCWNVIWGDLAHNFSDGITMGAAFSGCSPAVGWTITAANMMHEIPHEVGNFMALVNGGMSVKQALLYNFISALFAVLGVVLTLCLREVITAKAISFLLLFGAGTFIFVGLSELIPDALRSGTASTSVSADGSAKIDDDGEDKKEADRKSRHRGQVNKALAFTAGAVFLGLPLLAHTHCTADGHGHHHR